MLGRNRQHRDDLVPVTNTGTITVNSGTFVSGGESGSGTVQVNNSEPSRIAPATSSSTARSTLR